MGPDQLAQHLKAIREPRMRVLALIAALREGEASTWIEVLAALVTRAHTMGDADALAAVQAMVQAAGDPALTHPTRKALYEAAIARDAPSIARLFLSVSPATASVRQLEKQLAPERPLKPSGRALSLGERKALARTRHREQILLLLRDPHPAVVAILLDNPHVTESDVLKVASARPAVPESLGKIATHARWSVRHAVKRALVQNPAMPLADAMRIATTLRVAELAELANDPALPLPLREHAAQVRAASLERPRA